VAGAEILEGLTEELKAVEWCCRKALMVVLMDSVDFASLTESR
jgi:hypothetical protein